MGYVTVRAACYMLRGSKCSVLYVKWKYERRVVCFVAVRAVSYVLRGSKSCVFYVTWQ
jgi:hypothetical protein